MEFKLGDKVRILQFREEFYTMEKSPGFVKPMKELCGDEFIIEEFASFNMDWIRYGGWSWDKRWLELVEEEEEWTFDIDQAAFDAVLSLGG